ncbi:MAG TPA: type IV pilus assembly protein PilM [Verrucomicrobiota bacterium]|nr:type IV pilus assembly protein PilM [Verrucomicrobiota bacterium]
MFKSKSFLTMDCGASTLKVAEFEPNESGGLRLKKYALKSLGMEGAFESSRSVAFLKAMEDVFSNNQFSSKKVNICAPGFYVFTKFVKLPPVDSTKITQIVQFEAQQNVPFPLEEVVWDYQIVGTSSTGEFEVLLVAIKSDVVENLFRDIEKLGLVPQIVDVSTAALSNSFRFNYSDLDGCTMLLDIGAKTSNLMFFEKEKFFARNINIGTNLITQEFANESHLPVAVAEKIKIEKGFVSLGGAYEEPEDQQAAAISKIARQVMTRLHIQVNQTIQFYRQQQGGMPPLRLFLSGGGSTMPYTAQFFAEKLNLPVEYFNPFKNIEIDPSVNLEELAKVAHTFGEVNGLALRNLAHCPIEVNLLPPSYLKRQEFSQKKPYIIATLYSIVLGLFSFLFVESRVLEVKRAELDYLDSRYTPLNQNKDRLERELKKLEEIKQGALIAKSIAESRNFWQTLLPELRNALIETENEGKNFFKVDTGLWIEKMTTEMPQMSTGDLSIAPPSLPPTSPRQLSIANMPAITNIILTVRGVDMTKYDPSGNPKMAYSFLSKLHLRTNLFDTNGTVFKGTIVPDTNSFMTEVNVRLKKPLLL